MTEDDLRKLKIEDLRTQYPAVPKKLKKKAEIINWIIRNAVPGDVESVSSDVLKIPYDPSPEQVKRTKLRNIAPVFLKSVAAGVTVPTTMVIEERPPCRMCSSKGEVWSEVGIALCPMCCSGRDTSSPTPSVKLEKGVTWVPHTFDVNGRVVLRLGKVDPEQVCDLVLVYGFGVCESIEALSETGSVDAAAQKLMEKNLKSAENTSIAEAQLNSEELRESSKVTRKLNQRKARVEVLEDLTVLLDIDADFCSQYVFRVDADTTLAAWMSAEPKNTLLVFDYLILKRDSVRWYKLPASAYFRTEEGKVLNQIDTGGLCNWFELRIAAVSNAVYNIPETSGAIPVLFRGCQNDEPSNSDPHDDDLEIVGEHCKTDTSSPVVELLD